MITTRTRNQYDRSFHQMTYGERLHGRSPADLLTEVVNALTGEDGTLPRVSIFRHKSDGTCSVWNHAHTQTEFLSWLVKAIDGHLTAFEQDDYSTRLIVLDPDRIAWIEAFHPEADTNDYPYPAMTENAQ